MAKGKLTKTTNIMAKGKLTKDSQYHGQRETEERQTISWTMILSVFCQFPFGHDIVCHL
jgi:hypothetical protein